MWPSPLLKKKQPLVCLKKGKNPSPSKIKLYNLTHLDYIGLPQGKDLTLKVDYKCTMSNVRYINS